MTRVKRRFTEHASSGRSVVLKFNHPAAQDARTLFPSTVVDVADSPRLLVSGANQRKLGDRIVKGAWRGLPIYTLTLEERATCPRSCHHWLSCYGNNMHFSRRHRHGEELEKRLKYEVAALLRQHPQGVAVRLHILGDFYSFRYVKLWSDLLGQHPKLRVFGYTAWQPVTEVGAAIQIANELFPERCAIRFSGIESGPMHAAREGADGVVCPVQTGNTDCCGTCGLCWASAFRDKTIVFLNHGRRQ